MQYQAVLFDLDGTLADTALDLGGALNTLLVKRGLPPKNMEDIRPVASHGANGLILLGAGITKAHPDHTEWRQAYLAEYEQCFDCDTVLFGGVNEMLKGLAERSLKWGIVTNKPKTFAERLVSKLGFIFPPSVLVCGDTCDEAKPSIKPMLYACRQIAVAPERCLYVGDAERDILAGRNSGMTTVLADWGYIASDDRTEEWGADIRIAKPLDLLEHLD
ncbi:MAG: HAD family hydrolase [Neisseria sp.]|nr:HAD family hydrolase [Neisseria sp.]